MELNLCMNCMQEHEGPGPCPHCGFDESEYESLPHYLPLRTILNGKYLVGKVLGQGGFGITYLGWDLNLDIKLAIKEYYPNGFVSRESTYGPSLSIMTGSRSEYFQKGLAKFVDEAKRLGKFWGLPGIVAVKDYFRQNNTAYIVMEFAEGETLKEVLKKNNGRMRPDVLFEMMHPLFESLDVVHKAGIIHRDISPDNIMVDSHGHVKLLDFGAARDFISQDEKSLSVMLKPGYAPEEQYRSRGQQGPWTDVYGLCATIYRALTGEPPVESLDRMQEDTLKPLSAFDVSIPPWQEAALMKGLAVFANNRYSSVEELEKAIYETPADSNGEIAGYGGSGSAYNNSGRNSADSTSNLSSNGINGGIGGNINDNAGGNGGNYGGGGAGVGYNTGSGPGYNIGGGGTGYSGSGGTGSNAGSGTTPYGGDKKLSPWAERKNKKMFIIPAAVVAGLLLVIIIAGSMGGNSSRTPSPTPIAESEESTPYRLADDDQKGKMETRIPARTETETVPATEKQTETKRETETQKQTETERETETSAPSYPVLDIDRVDEILDENGGGATFGVCVYDIRNDVPYVGKNGDTSMLSSALTNICTLFTVGLMCDNDMISLNDSILFSYTFDGRGIRSKSDNGSYYYLSELLANMLQYSDNNAANSIMDYIGIDRINTLCEQVELYSVDVQRNYSGNTSLDNYASAEDIALMLTVMYQGVFDSIDKSYMKNNFYIADKVSDKGIAKPIPSSYTVLNHNGVRTNIYNEAAIIIGDDAEYVVVIMSNGGKQDTEAAAIAKASEYIFDTLTN